MARVAGVLALLVATGTAVAAPGISIQPPSISFFGGRAAFSGGPPGEPQFAVFQFENTGTTPLIVTDMAITGPDAGIIAFDGQPCSGGQDCAQHFSVAPGKQLAFGLTCLPTQPGVFSASLVITSNVGHQSSIPMTCIGNRAPIIAISPGDGFDFGVAIACNGVDPCDPFCPPTRPLLQTVTITNLAPAPSELDFYITPSVNGVDEFDFSTSDQGSPDYPIALAAGQSYPFTVVFHPGDLGERGPGPLSLVSLFPGQAPISIPFHAEGGEGRLVIDTPEILGTAMYGQTITTSITAHNAGNACLTIDNFSFSFGDCQVTGDNPVPHTFQAGESFTRDITCTPSLAWGGGAMLEADVPYVDPDAVFQFFAVIATGGALLTDASLDFPAPVEVGSSATFQSFVENAGSDPTQLVSITSTNPAFTATLVDSSLPLTLAVGDRAAIDVTFSPTAAASASGAVVFEVSAGLGATLPVSAQGVPAGSDVARRARVTANDESVAPEGGGCSTTGGAGLPLALGALWLLMRRRAATAGRRSSRRR